MLEFIEYINDSVINIRNECGDMVGDLVFNQGKYGLSLCYLCNNTEHLRQIADKLDELNKF